MQYIGNAIFIQEKRVCVRPLCNRLEAIQRLQPPVTVKGCRSFARMVNFLSRFCPDFQKLLKPIYDLTREDRQFIWGQEQQSALQKPPVLHLLNGKGRFHLYSDTSKYAMGSALYQIQNSKPKLIAYASKRLTEAAKNYSITELEICGLTINIVSFAPLLKKADSDAIVDHLAFVHILKSKAETVTTRIKRLLEVFSAYSFNLCYMRGKDMILSDFLSRQRTEDRNIHEIIPISFGMQAILRDRYYNVGQEKESRYLIQTWSQPKSSGIKLLAVHGVVKGVDPSVKPEKQILKPIKLAMKPNPQVQSKSRLGQSRAGLRRKMKIPVQIQTQIQTSGVDQVKEQAYQDKRK